MDKKKAHKNPSVTPKQKNGTNGCSYCLGCFIGFILIVFGLTAVNLHQFVYHYKYHDLSGHGEFSVRNFADDVNTVLCHGYEVTPFLRANVYLIEGEARIKRHHREISRRDTKQLVPDSDLLDNAFYLLEGSHIHVNACKEDDSFFNEDTAQILLFKGDKSWTRWKKGKCGNCPVESAKVKRNDFCGGSKSHLDYAVHHRDTYYIALYKEGEFLTSFKADATIRRTTFDLRHARERCYMSSDCYLNLTYGKEMDVVVQFTDSMTISSFGTKCRYRTMFWVGVFVFIPSWLISMALCCCCCCARAESKKKSKCRLDPENATNPLLGSKADILGNELPPDYKSIPQTGNIQIA